MKQIHINASRQYDVLVGSDLIANAGNYIPAFRCGTKAAIISDSNVWPIYGTALTAALENAGLQVVHFVFPAGEASKTADTYLSILNFLA